MRSPLIVDVDIGRIRHAPVNRAPTADGETPRIMLTPPRRV
jgi:hypothetical protein